MAMKKKIAVGIGAVLITAMCFGGSVFAESTPVNGTGDSGSAEGSTNATVTYTKGDESTPTWSVNIPKSVDFGTVNVATTALTQKLEYTANIQNDTSNTIKSLKISLVDGPKYAMKDTGHDPAVTVSNAFSIKNAAGGEVTANSAIAEIASGETANAQAVLDLNAFTSATLTNGNHAFTGQFGVKIEPVKATS